MANDPILDAISGKGVSQQDTDSILAAIGGKGAGKVRPAPTDPILAAINGDTGTGKARPLASSEMIGQWAHDNNATIREAHQHFRTQGYAITPEEMNIPVTPQAPIVPNPPAESGIPTTPPGQPWPQWFETGLEKTNNLLDLRKKVSEPIAQGVKDAFQFPGQFATSIGDTGQQFRQLEAARYGQASIPQESLEEEAARKHPIIQGVTGAVGETIGGTIGDPLNWPFFASGAARPLLQKLISGGFGVLLSRDAIQRAKQLSKDWNALSPEQRTEQITGLGLNTLFAGAAGAHALSGTIGAGEQLHPEKPETLQAQVDALENGTSKAVYFPKGQSGIPEAPEGANVTVVKGNKPGSGTWFHSDKITPEQIHASVKDGTFHQLLGHVQSKEEASANGQPVGVMARDENGTELKGSLVDATNPQAIAQQAAELGRQFPNGKIGVETPEQVIQARQGPASGHAKAGFEEEAAPGDPILEAIGGRAIEPPEQAVTERRVSQGISPTGAERRSATIPFAGIQGPPPEQLRLQTEARKQVEAAQTVEEKTQALNRLKQVSGTEAGLDIAAHGGEKMAEEIRQARAAKPAEPIVKKEAAPQYAYRVRTVGEEGIPRGGHAQATLSEQEARGYMEGRGELPENAGKQQELVRTDLSKLKPEDYSIKPGPNGHGWVKFAEPRPESEVERVEQPAEEQATQQPKPLDVLAQKTASIEKRQSAGEKIPLSEIHDLHALMNQIEASPTEPARESAKPVDPILEAISGGSPESSKRLTKTESGYEGLEELSKAAGHGPGTPLAGEFDRTGTRIDELAQTIRENSAATKPIKSRIDLGAKVAAKVAGAKDAVTRGLATVKGVGAAMLDAFRRPEPWTDFEDALGKYQGAVQRSAFEIRGLAKSLTKAVPDKVRREAMANYMEAGGDAATLKKWAEASKGARKLGYEAALNLTDAEKTIARNMMLAQDERFQLDKEAGLVEHEVANYVQHIWGRESKFTRKVVNNVRAMMLETKPSFTKQRVFSSYFEGEQLGYKPVDKDAGFLFAAREHSANQAIAARAFIKSLLDGKAADGRPLAAVSGSGRAIKEGDEGPKAYLIDAKTKPEEVADYRSVDHPALRKWTWVGTDETGKPSFVRGDIVVHPDAYGKLKNVLGKSALRSYTIPGTEIQPGRLALKLSSEFKNTLLSFSAFHQTQEGLHALFHQVNPFTTKALDFRDPVQAKLVDHGLQVATFDAQEQFGEGLSSGLTQKLPIIGKYFRQYNDYLFSDLIPRLKMTLAGEALERNLARYKGKLTEDQVYALTANQANAAFGELNYTMMARNKNFQDVLRMTLLAPDFLEARGRFVGQAVKPYGREQAFALMRGALGLYVGARLLNAAFNNGDPKWDPDNAFSLVYKGHSFTLRSVPGDIAHLFTDPRGFVYNRLNPVYGRGTVEALTGRDQYGKKRGLGEQAKDLVRGSLPIPFQGFTKNGETSPLDTVLSSAGVATNKYRTPAERLARQITADRMPAGSGEMTEKAKLARTLEDGIRAGKFQTQEIGKHMRTGELTEGDALKILKSSQMTELVRDVKRFSIEDASRVWSKANDQEREELRGLLQEKAERFAVSADKYTPKEWAATAAKIRALDLWGANKAKPKTFAGAVPFLPPGSTGTSVPLAPPQ